MNTTINKETFVQILKSVGLNEEQMKNFHREVEKQDPAFHELFLRMLAIPEGEITKIRKI